MLLREKKKINFNSVKLFPHDKSLTPTLYLWQLFPSLLKSKSSENCKPTLYYSFSFKVDRWNNYPHHYCLNKQLTTEILRIHISLKCCHKVLRNCPHRCCHNIYLKSLFHANEKKKFIEKKEQYRFSIKSLGKLTSCMAVGLQLKNRV